jgi:lipopolysaccharide cholinephosphotransferase
MIEYARLFANNPIDEKTTFLATIAGETIYRKKWFDESIEVGFEGKLFNAPAQYDLILRQRYGDYMKLPPEKERVIPHRFQAFYK